MDISFRRPVSARIGYIYKHFYENYRQDLLKDLLSIASMLCKSLEFSADIQYYISRELMNALIKSITLDIIKYKDFHFTSSTAGTDGYDFGIKWMESIHNKEISASKHASFLVKWIVRHSPISLYLKNSYNATAVDLDKVETINILFAQQVAFKYSGIDARHITNEQIIDVIYHLRFREINERHFFHWFEALRRISLNSMTPKRTYNVFVASPGDCNELRLATEEVLEQIESMYSYPIFSTYMWEKDKRAGYVGDNYQEQIYEEAKRKWNGGDCDILILFAWKKFGVNTTNEYNWFIEHIIDKSLNKEKDGKKLLLCQYSKDISPTTMSADELTSTAELKKWIESIQDNIAPLGHNRSAIDNVEDFKKELRKEIGLHLNRE